MIICEGVSKTYNSKYGIHNINLTFSPGKIYGIIGYNGAGKTTLLRCIEGLYIPTTGRILHNEIDTKNEKQFGKHKQNISFLPTDDYLYPNLTCLENIELAAILRTGTKTISKQIYELIKYFDAKDFLDKKFKFCSTGMKKKIQLIASLVGETNTIIWDEPNDGLDIISNIKLKKLVGYFKEKNKIILLSSHVAEFMDDFIDYYVLLKDGHIAEQNEYKNINSLNELLLKHIDSSSLELNITDL